MAIDLHLAEGQETLRRLATKVDVIVDFRPGTLDRRNLAIPMVFAPNPRLAVLCTVTVGRSDPNSPDPGSACWRR